MTTTRRIGSVAAVGALALSIALLTGLPSAVADEASTVQWPQQQAAPGGASGADELTTLKANQQLLQQEIDQLALGAPQGVPPAGSSSLAGSFPRSFLIPGTDTSLLVGGFVELDTCYWLEGGGAQGNGSNQLCGLEGPPLIASVGLDSHGTGLFAASFFNSHSRGTGVFDMTARYSRLRVETRTPTAWGEAGTVVEMDFAGCQASGFNCNDNDYGPSTQTARLRLAYGTLGGFIAGQAYIPVQDLDANPETLDLSGDVGIFGAMTRVPLVGYKYSLPYGMSFTVAAIQPATSIYTPSGAMTSSETGGTAGSLTANTTAINTDLGTNPAKAELPNLNLALRWQQPWGSLQIAGVLQQLVLDDGAFVSKDFLGGGGVVETDVHPGWFGWTKDHIGAQLWAGNGLDRYGGNPTGTEPGTWPGIATNFGGPQVGCYGYSNSSGGTLGGGTLEGAAGQALCTAPGNTAANGAKVIATTIVSYGGEANYQHWWTPNLRTNITFGFQQQDIPTQLVQLTNESLAFNKRLISDHINLIWSPVAFINTGFEYIYGNRLTVWNQTGNEHVIDYTFQVKF
jgi:Porin subfamily